jgi:predicted nucleic acid-binding protein
MTVFVDTSAWFAAANVKDRHRERASELVRAEPKLTTSTFVLVETWLLLQSKIAFTVVAEYIRAGAATLEETIMSDLQHAWQMRNAFQDQSFSLVDRTSFAMMERLGISRVISFDDDFVIYRFGPDRRLAFEVLR